MNITFSKHFFILFGISNCQARIPFAELGKDSLEKWQLRSLQNKIISQENKGTEPDTCQGVFSKGQGAGIVTLRSQSC